jgi:hypothetical protein
MKPEEEKQEEIGEGAAGGWGGWLSSTLVSAKEKSSEMFNYLKQDLSEFTETVQEAGREIKDKLKLEDTMKTAVTAVGTKANVVLEQMSTIFGIGPDDEDEELVMGRPTARTRVRAKIYTMSYDESLFLEDPQDIDDYERWMSHFDLEEENEETVNLLAHNSNLQEQYTKLVPSKVSHLVFWHRFYYLVHLMLEAEKKSAAMSTTNNQPVASSAPSETDVNIQPDALGGDSGLVEISEEDQKRLLAEYEEEMKKCDEDSGRNSRRSSGPLSSSSSSSFAFVTHDASTDEVRVD